MAGAVPAWGNATKGAQAPGEWRKIRTRKISASHFRVRGIARRGMVLQLYFALIFMRILIAAVIFPPPISHKRKILAL